MNLSSRKDFPETDFEHLKAVVTWNALVEPGDRIAGELIRQYGPIDALEVFVERQVADEEHLRAFERWAPRYASDLAEEKLALAQKYDLQVLLPADELWPKQLNDLGAHAPLLLWYRGNTTHFGKLNKVVGIVGSRNASHYGQRVTSDLASQVVGEEAAIVSGGALGIDSVAHRTAIQLGGLTAAFMAGSLDCLYPAANFSLFDEIGHRGLLLSEMSPGSRPTRWRFLQRNRLIAAIGDATVVTEAGWRSGSINTVKHANELGRPVFAVPGPITSPASAGCNRLIRDSEAAILVELSELAVELGWRANHEYSSEILGPLDLRAFDALEIKFQSVETLLRASGLSLNELRMALGSLKLLGKAETGESGLWRRAAEG